MVAFVVALGIIAMIIVVGYATQATRDANGRIDDDRKAWLDSAEAKLRARYFASARDQVSAADAAPEAELFARAGVVPRWNAGILLSNVLTDAATGISYTSMVLWLPGLNDDQPPPAFDPDTGHLKICPSNACPERAFRLISGVNAQREALDATRRTLGELAAKAETYAKARTMQDPDHDLSRNPFRWENCGVPEDSRPPCMTGDVTLYDSTAGNTAALFGISPSEAVDGWGHPILVNNENGAKVVTPPYFVEFKAAAPWGESVISTAAQPL